MKYGRAISSAFSTLKSGSLWGFVASIYGAITLLYVALFGGAIAIVGPSRLVELFNSPGSGGSDWIAPVLLLGGTLLLAMLLVIPLSLIMHGGLVHLSDEILANRPVTVGQGWSFGASRMRRTFAIDFLVGLIVFGVMLVALVPFGISVAGLAAGSGSGASSGVAFGGICCGYLIFFLFAVATSMLASGYEAVAIRYGLVGTRSAGQAMGAAWQAFKARWKDVVVFSLIVLGLQYTFSFATSIVTGPMQFFLLPNAFTTGGSTPSADQLPRFFVGFTVLMIVSIVITVPWVVFQYSLWSAFFRQLTGLEVVVAAPISSEPPSALAPEPPAAENTPVDG